VPEAARERQARLASRFSGRLLPPAGRASTRRCEVTSRRVSSEQLDAFRGSAVALPPRRRAQARTGLPKRPPCRVAATRHTVQRAPRRAGASGRVALACRAAGSNSVASRRPPTASTSRTGSGRSSSRSEAPLSWWSIPPFGTERRSCRERRVGRRPAELSRRRGGADGDDRIHGAEMGER
jgi:hypothetical protein